MGCTGIREAIDSSVVGRLFLTELTSNAPIDSPVFLLGACTAGWPVTATGELFELCCTKETECLENYLQGTRCLP